MTFIVIEKQKNDKGFILVIFTVIDNNVFTCYNVLKVNSKNALLDLNNIKMNSHRTD